MKKAVALGEKYEVDADDLYGGVFDIAAGANAPIDYQALNAALLFYDAVAVTDSWFMARGPIATNFAKEAKDPAFNLGKRIESYLKSGLVVPNLRIGTTLYEAWTRGAEVGLAPGTNLTLAKAEGDYLFTALQGVGHGRAIWPQAMADGTSRSFGAMCVTYLLDPQIGLPTAEHAESVLSRSNLNGVSLGERRIITQMLESLWDVISTRSNTKEFRRGLLEQTVADVMRWPMRDFYDNVWREQGALGETIRSTIRLISSVYELNQSQNFGTSLLFTMEQDPIVAYNEETISTVNSGRIATHSVELMREVDFSALTITDINSIRDDSENDIFMQAKQFRRDSLKNKDMDSLSRLNDFLEQRYVPHILARAPHARRLLSEGVSRRTVGVAGQVGAWTSLVSLLVGGQIGIGVFEPIYQAALGTMSFIGLSGIANERIYKGIGKADRFFYVNPARRRALSKLQREFAVIDAFK